MAQLQQPQQIDLSDIPDDDAIDLSDIPNDPQGLINANPLSPQQTPTTQPQAGLLKRAWNTATAPIVDIRSSNPQLKRATDLFAEQHPVIGGGMNVLTDIVSGLSSPLNLATMGVGAGEAATGSRALGIGRRVLSAPVAAEGAYNIATQPGGVNKAVGALELAGGLLGMKAKIPPVKTNLGSKIPLVAKAAERELVKDIPSIVPDEIQPSAIIEPTTAAVEPPKKFVNPFEKPTAPAQELQPTQAALPLEEITPEKLPDIPPQELAVQPPTVIQKLVSAIDEGLAKAKEQAASITKQKGERMKNVRAITTPGMKGYYQKLGALRGEYDKLGMPPLSEILDPKDIDDIRNIIDASPLDDEFAKIHATSGLVKLLNGQIPQPSELDILNNILRTSIEVPGISSKPKVPSKLLQAYQLFKGLKATDVPFMTSAAFRQGGPYAGTRQWFQAFKEQAKSFPSEKVYDKIMEGIEANPIHRKRIIATPSGETEFASIADQIGLASSDLKTLSRREEQLKGIIAERIPVIGPWVRASNRSFTAFLNSLRTSQAYDQLTAAGLIDSNGRITNLDDAKRIAYTVNELTGHGSLKVAAPFSRFTKSGRELNLEKSADALGYLFFSPRNMARDARMMNPLNYMKNDKLVRMEYLKGAMRRAAVWAGFTTMGALGLDATVNWDPTSSDFGKIKLGDTRADAGSGLLQWAVLTAREALGGKTSSSRPNARFQEYGTSPVAGSRMESALEFAGNRLNPALAPVVNFATASKNRPFYPLSEAGEAITPFPVADTWELYMSDPDMAQIILGLAASGVSMGSQTYGRRDYGKPTFDIPGDPAFQGGSLIPK